MAKNSKRKLLFTTILLAALLISSAYAALIPNAQAMQMKEITTKDKGLLALNTVVGLNLTDYSVTTKENSAEKQISYLDVLPQEDIEYDLLSGENMLKALCTFVDGNLIIINVLENSGPPSMINSEASANAVDMAKDFLGNYQAYTANPLYGELRSSLVGVDAGKNATKTTAGNTQLEVTAIGSRTTFRWTYVLNGAIAPSKVVALSFKNGFLSYFVDKWNLYSVGTTSISLSKDEAVTIALETAKAYNWSVKLDADALDVKNFNASNVRWTSLIFDDSLGAVKARNEDLLTVYPVWRVGVALDKWYGQLYGIEVDVWADSGLVRRVQEAWSTLPPPEGVPTANMNDQAAASEAAPNLAMLIGFPTAALAALGVALVWVSRKKKACLHSLLKSRSLKIGGILLCVLLWSTVLLGTIVTVNAITRAGVIWGSESTGQNAQEWWGYWRKSSEEIELQQETAVSIKGMFDDNGYTGVNHQGILNPGSSRSQILSDISYYQSNYDYVAVVDFDHGVGRSDYLAAPPGEFHYMFEDNTGTIIRVSIPNPPYYMDEPHPEHGVYDNDIYYLIQPGNKIVFAFINTCWSAHTIGQGLLPPHWPSYPSRAVTLPFAWTNRLVMDKSSPDFNIEDHISDDGYRDPDYGPQVYIGFPDGSASLMQRIPYPSGTHNYKYWVEWFFDYALDSKRSVNDALDEASLLTWSKSFEESPLQEGFSAYWWPLDPQPDCTMAVYGNGEIFLKYYDPNYVSTPSVGGPTSGYMGTAYEFSASSTGPYGHNIRYMFDWGDGSPYTVTDWYPNGAIAHASHSWNSENEFDVKVKAECDNGVWSGWSSPHTIVIGDLPTLTVTAFSGQYGELYGVPVWIDYEYAGTTPYSDYVSPGSYQIEVPDNLYFTAFICYNYGSNNPLTLQITSDTNVIACYY